MPHKKPAKPVKSKLKAKPKAKPIKTQLVKPRPKRKPPYFSNHKYIPGKDYSFLSNWDKPRGPAWAHEPSRYNKGIKKGIKKK